MHGSSDSTAVTVTQHGDHLVTVRSAHEPDECARMRHEAAILGQIDHPGIVRLVDHTDGPPARLRTAFVGPDTWRTRPPTGGQVAAALAAVATTVADLHDAGLTHGDIRADNILIDPAGRPVLCGLAQAEPVDPATIAADVRALVALGRELARGAGGEQESIEAVLATLEAGHDDLRGTVRDLGRRRLPPAAPAPRFDRRTLVAAGGVVVVVVAVAAALLLRPASDTAVPAAAPLTTTVPDPPADTTEPPTTTSTTPPLATTAAVTANELIHDGRRYTIGRPGDVVVTGDWDCDGTPTPALLRPDTGEVAVFAAWPAADAAIAPAATTVVEGAIDLSPTDEACPILRATTSTGSRLITASGAS